MDEPKPRYPWLSEIPVVVNSYLPSGKAYLVSEGPQPLRGPVIAGIDWGSEDSTSITMFCYLPLQMPDPRRLVALDNIMAATEAEDRRWRRRERKMLSLKRRAKAQRRLDYTSNVRRRKRWAELRRRGADMRGPLIVEMSRAELLEKYPHRGDDRSGARGRVEGMRNTQAK